MGSSESSNMIKYDSTVDLIKREWDKSLQNLQKINIIIAGISGVGKSTLLNQFFGVEELSKTGLGDSVTKIIKPYNIKNNLINIWDTHGIEMSENDIKDLLEDIFKVVTKGAQSKDANQFISCILYCVNCNSSRFFEKEENFIKKLTTDKRTKHIPIIIVITQCYINDKAKELKQHIEKKNLKNVKVVDVLALKSDHKDSYGLDNLNDLIQDSFPEALKKTLIYNQVVSIRSQRKYAFSVVIFSSLCVAAINYSQLLTMYNNALFPAEITTMVATITIIYGINFSETLISAFVTFILKIGVEKLTSPVVQKLFPFVKYGISTNSSILVFIIGVIYLFFIEIMIERRINNQPIDEESCKRVLENLLEIKNIEKRREMLEYTSE